MHKILKVTTSDELYAEVLTLRYNILRAPIGMEFSQADLEYDHKVIYFAYVKDDQVLGAVGLDISKLPLGRLTQMAVSESAQGLGVGRELVLFLEEYAKQNAVSDIYLDARYPARGFYNKLKYNEYGDVFEKIGIPHVRMIKSLA